LPKVIKYFEEKKDFIDIIFSKAYGLICKKNKSNMKDEKKNIEAFNEIKNEIFDNSYITYNTVDIVGIIINDVIIETN